MEQSDGDRHHVLSAVFTFGRYALIKRRIIALRYATFMFRDITLQWRIIISPHHRDDDSWCPYVMSQGLRLRYLEAISRRHASSVREWKLSHAHRATDANAVATPICYPLMIIVMAGAVTASLTHLSYS